MATHRDLLLAIRDRLLDDMTRALETALVHQRVNLVGLQGQTRLKERNAPRRTA